MPKPYPEELREDVVRVARNRGPGVTVEQAAADFGVHAITPWKWMRRADVDAGTKPGTTGQESTELRETRRRIKLLEQENEVLRRATYPVAGVSAGKRIYPLVREVAMDGIPVTVACRVLKLASPLVRHADHGRCEPGIAVRRVLEGDLGTRAAGSPHGRTDRNRRSVDSQPKPRGVRLLRRRLLMSTAPTPAWGPPEEVHPPSTDVRKKHHRIFLWVFLAVQALFLVWIITGANSNDQAPCEGMAGDALTTCQNAGDVGTAIGVGLIITLWVAVDIILGITYGVYRLARRQRA
ncbi:transposase [Streptomyces microflavus]|uniref:transposase n=1 Tax=Streptomyces microflavus TaxID=1919 RepID=UPI0037D7B1A9